MLSLQGLLKEDLSLIRYATLFSLLRKHFCEQRTIVSIVGFDCEKLTLGQQTTVHPLSFFKNEIWRKLLKLFFLRTSA